MIDLTQEKDNDDLTEQLRESTKKEMEVLRIGSEHPNISKNRLVIWFWDYVVCRDVPDFGSGRSGIRPFLANLAKSSSGQIFWPDLGQLITSNGTGTNIDFR